MGSLHHVFTVSSDQFSSGVVKQSSFDSLNSESCASLGSSRHFELHGSVFVVLVDDHLAKRVVSLFLSE